MKNTITNFALVLAAFIAVNLLMSFAKPVAAPDEPKQYIILESPTGAADTRMRGLEKEVNQKLSEGWHVQGGVVSQGFFYQAMVK